MGVVAVIYFRQMKNLTLILTLCTLLSLPAYSLFWSGYTINNPEIQVEGSILSLEKIIVSLSLANIGEKQIKYNELNLSKERQIADLFCETGSLGEVQRYGIAEKSTEDMEVYKEDTFCDIDFVGVNDKTYQADCFGKQICKIEFIDINKNNEWLGPNACNVQTAAGPVQESYALFFEYECNIDTVELAYYGKIDRNQLANIVISCDALIVILFTINIMWLSR